MGSGAPGDCVHCCTVAAGLCTSAFVLRSGTELISTPAAPPCMAAAAWLGRGARDETCPCRELLLLLSLRPGRPESTVDERCAAELRLLLQQGGGEHMEARRLAGRDEQREARCCKVEGCDLSVASRGAT
mmetsp:Transcript_105914/g.316330  ORF Transcript_105914/g.316330 Transcript_105914/m.316330 type:complete len:130 (-) Transcript_105914:367-756(-)